MKKRALFTVIFYGLIIFMLISWLAGLFGAGNDVTYSQILELFDKEQVKSFTVSEGVIVMQLREPLDGKREIEAVLADPEGFHQEMAPLLREQSKSGVLESYNFLPDAKISPYSYVIPIILAGLVLLLVWFFFMSRINSNSGMSNFGKARTVLGIPDKKKVTFDDVAGADEEKQELQEAHGVVRGQEQHYSGSSVPHERSPGSASRAGRTDSLHPNRGGGWYT